MRIGEMVTHLRRSMLRRRRGGELAGLEKVQQRRLASEIQSQKEEAAALVPQPEEVEQPREGAAHH